MAAVAGREFTVKDGGTAIAGLRTTSVSVDNSPVDITDKGDSGFRTLASFAGKRTLEISAEGVFDENTIRAQAMGTATQLLTDITLEFGDDDTLSGDFYLASFESAGDHDGEETYSVTFQSSGAWTYTDTP
jgi:TP901-1 family phage major tail protein